MSYAIRSGIALTSTYALKQCSRLLKTVDGHDKSELAAMQLRLDSKIKVYLPALCSVYSLTQPDYLSGDRHD